MPWSSISTYWGYEERWTRETLRPLAEEMGTHLSWDAPRIQEEIELVLRVIRLPGEFQAPVQLT